MEQGRLVSSAEELTWGAGHLAPPQAPSSRLWNPLIKLGAEISALKCRLCAQVQAAAPELGGHSRSPISLNGPFVPAQSPLWYQM